MTHLQRLGDQISVPIPPDEDDLTGRECPVRECLGYFKIQFGTGLKGQNLPCHCPYCGHEDSHNKFWTPEQIEYAKSVAINKITGALIKDLKTLEFDHRPRGAFGIGLSMKVTGRPQPIRYFREKELETEVICSNCTLRYAIYGLFAYCPDCGEHNSLQILHKNLELAEKEIALAATVERNLSEHLIGDALENAVATFDGFGRESCRIRSGSSTNPAKAQNISFQNLANARQKIQDLFGFDITNSLSLDEWSFTSICFQKRHLLAHKMGIVDEAYVRITNDPNAILGRKVSISSAEVASLIQLLKKLGGSFISHLPK
jgi:hypothetical protein